MNIHEVTTGKKAFLNLLLLADEQEDMIDRYLEKGTMYVLDDDDGVKAECVVTDEGGGVLEIKNIAVLPERRRQGYGKRLLQFIERKYGRDFRVLRVGTGDSPLTLPFYKKYGFAECFRLRKFFTENYDHPIYECGVQLIDMVYLEKNLQG